MNEQPVQVDTLVVQVREIPLRKLPNGPERMFVQTAGTDRVLVDFADGVKAWGKALELDEAGYEALRQEAFRMELADLDDIPTYTELYPLWNYGGTTTTPNGNTLGRVNGETPASAQAANDANPEVESETPSEGVTGNEILDGIQLGLDIVGLIPVVGELADVANAGISLARGDYAGAALSLLSAIPLAGYAGSAGKVVWHATKATVETTGKAAREVAEARVRKEAKNATGAEKKEIAPGGRTKAKKPLDCGQKGSYGQLNKFDASSGEMERDHIPPKAALLQKAVDLYEKSGRTLDPDELKTLARKIERHGQAVSIPKDIHRNGITHSNPNNKKYSGDLQAVAREESRNHRENMRRDDKNHRCMAALQKATGELGKITNKQYDDFLRKLIKDTLSGKQTRDPWKGII